MARERERLAREKAVGLTGAAQREAAAIAEAGRLERERALVDEMKEKVAEDRQQALSVQYNHACDAHQCPIAGQLGFSARRIEASLQRRRSGPPPAFEADEREGAPGTLLELQLLSHRMKSSAM